MFCLHPLFFQLATSGVILPYSEPSNGLCRSLTQLWLTLSRFKSKWQKDLLTATYTFLFHPDGCALCAGHTANVHVLPATFFKGNIVLEHILSTESIELDIVRYLWRANTNEQGPCGIRTKHTQQESDTSSYHHLCP